MAIDSVLAGIAANDSASALTWYEREQMLTTRWYRPEEAAQGFVEAELENPTTKLVLFTVRPDRWLTAGFAGGPESPRWNYGK